MRSRATRMCQCGHERRTHEHFRRGSDCGVCGRPVCPQFRKAMGTRQFVRVHKHAHEHLV